MEYLGSDLCSLLWVDCADVLVMFQCVLPVLLLCTDVLLQQTQHLTGLVVAVLYGVSVLSLFFIYLIIFLAEQHDASLRKLLFSCV